MLCGLTARCQLLLTSVPGCTQPATASLQLMFSTARVYDIELAAGSSRKAGILAMVKAARATGC